MRLGVLGTMVWDRIYARDGRPEPFEEWGGISYALAAADAAVPDGWSIVPILKVGADLQDRAFDFLRTLEHTDLQSGVRVVERPNYRVELRYRDDSRRTERLTGGVGSWTWDELAPIVAQVDALYINFISGFELELEETIRLRLHYHGPMYADLHSLMLGVDPSGVRTPRPLAAWREWLRCFDVIQVNEDELDLVAYNWGDPWRFAAEMVNDELKLLLVTLAERGAAYVASPSFCPDPRVWRPQGLVQPTVRSGGGAESRHIVPTSIPLTGDPTGCGDVWGATCFCRLLAHNSLEDAMGEANRAAGRNVQHRGASGLNHFLRGRISR
jgi:sugar/nucleoside kinase (ribokinase family)